MAAESEIQEGFFRQAGAAVKEKWDNLHIGDGHFTAWVRQGFKEVTHLLLPAFPAGQHVVEEPGLLGNPTQGEVARGRQDQQPAKQHVSTLNEEPMQTQASVPSPGDLAEGKSIGSVRGEQSQAVKQEPPSPGDLAEGKGIQPEQQSQGQQQSQRHGMRL